MPSARPAACASDPTCQASRNRAAIPRRGWLVASPVFCVLTIARVIPISFANSGDSTMKRDLISIADLTTEEILALVDLAARLKAERKAGQRSAPLDGLAIALLFLKP